MRNLRNRADQLTWKEVLNQPEWAPVVQAYQQCSQYDQFDRLFERPQGIHGVHHARRVLFHTLVLCKLCNVEAQDQRLLVSAALFHDIGRDNDGRCLIHGKLSVEKMLRLNLVSENQESAERLKFIISYHCIGDEEGWSALQQKGDLDREKTWRLFGILKDADGLDRVRINDLDTSYLRNPEALRMERLASELFAKI